MECIEVPAKVVKHLMAVDPEALAIPRGHGERLVQLPDGLGSIKNEPSRVDYQPFPQYSAAVWLMVQLRRWNMLKDDIDFKKLAEQVMLATDAARIMKESGVTPPAGGFGKEIILGREFDSSKPDEYLKSIRKT